MPKTEPQVKEKAGLLTIPQTFEMAVNQLIPLAKKLDEDDREVLLAHMEYVRALVESQAIVDRMIEAATQNFTMALSQRDQALRILSMWQEHGVDAAMAAAAEFFHNEIYEGADPELVKIALRRALGFEVGYVDMEALADFYDAIEKLTDSVTPDTDEDIA